MCFPAKLKQLFIIFLVILSMSSNVYAAEPQAGFSVGGEANNIQFTDSKLVTASYINKVFPFLDQPLTENDAQSLAIRDLFEYYYQQTNGKYFQKLENGEFSTILTGTILITEDEWAFIQENWEEPLTEKVVDIFAERVANADEIVAGGRNTTTYEQFYSIVENFMPEYKDWVQENRAAIEFWIKESLKQQDFVQYYFSDILHETLHEASARKSGTFQSRRTTQNSWQVWRRDSHSWKLLNPQSNEWLTLSVNNLPGTFSVLDREFFVDQGLQTSSLYLAYSQSSSTVNKYNLIGIMDELQSVIVAMRADAILNSIDYYGDDVRVIASKTIQDYCWFRGLALHYVSELKTYNKPKYEQLMENDLLIELLRDMINYGDDCALSLGRPSTRKSCQLYYDFALSAAISVFDKEREPGMGSLSGFVLYL